MKVTVLMENVTPSARYYTFHCTGLDAYGILRDELGERVSYLYTGAKVEV